VTVQILKGDCRDVLRTLPDESVHCVVTSPPYFGLRDYGVAGQIGLETTPEAFTAELVAVFASLRRVLRKDGTAWLNLGDSYTSGGRATWRSGASENKGQDVQNDMARPPQPDGLKAKDLLGIPWRVAFALQADGWYLRQDIIWSKPNPMPESVRDRCTKAHEYLFLLSKSERYHFDQDAIREPFADASIERLRQDIANQKGSDRVPGKTNGAMKAVGLNANRSSYRPGTASNTDGAEHIKKSDAGLPLNEAGRNKRSVWEVTTVGFAEAHFATFPPALIEPCILAGCPAGGTVLDPFGGAGTTGLVADRLGRNAILIELNPEYAAMAERRIRGDAGMFAEVTA
jgi:DNA modification methylase